MSDPIAQFLEQGRLRAGALLDFGKHLIHPTVRLGVTGMSRAGKTVFITALVNGLVRGGRLPIFEALASGRVASAQLAPQPDDAVPRFDYETHVRALTVERRWPESTRQISELRLVIEYQARRGALRTLTLDIVDYPGEWLLDLPLLNKSYEDWARETLAASRQEPRAARAAPRHPQKKILDPNGAQDEQAALTAASLFTDYLSACRDRRFAISMLPPGRFLMPGDLAGSPALTFAPLDLPPDGSAPAKSLGAMMQRRYESYKAVLVRPFFREHFSRLDRQIVLVDVLSTLNAGPDALRDLESALASILDCFNPGRRSLLSTLFNPRIDRILFAATKADHLHRSSHDRLEAILRRITERAIGRATFAGATIDVIALAAIRATREATIRQGGVNLPAILGVPAAGEVMGQQVFDGKTEIAMFPGDLPDDPNAFFNDPSAFRGLTSVPAPDADFRFLHLLPPALTEGEPLPHIRLDRALELLIGDRLS
jgi:predicted YcjX-like family ATPase